MCLKPARWLTLAKHNEPSYDSLQLTDTMDKQTSIETFFQRVVLRRFTNSDLGVALLASGGQEAMTGNYGGETSVWTEKQSQYARHEPVDRKDDRLVVFKLYLRATSLQSIKTEQPHRTWLQLPQVMGGFFTGFVVFGVSIVLAVHQSMSSLVQCCGRCLR